MAEHVERLAAKMKEPSLIPRTHIVEGEKRRDETVWSGLLTFTCVSCHVCTLTTCMTTIITF